ncbi:hypothetical protein ACGFZG_27015 [Streptomyces antibioticus]|uniref:hypothetical protein n=1 Tax=Streptomyces antibioticus TaxID=1890 RepID=UPI0036F90E7E
MPRQPRDESPESDSSSHSVYRNVVVIQPHGNPEAVMGEETRFGPQAPAGYEAYYDVESNTYLAVDRRNRVVQQLVTAGQWIQARREGLVKLLVDSVPTLIQSTAAVLPEEHPAKKSMTYAGIGAQAVVGAGEFLYETYQAVQGNEFKTRDMILGGMKVASAGVGAASEILQVNASESSSSTLPRNLTAVSNYTMGAATMTKAALDMQSDGADAVAKRAVAYQHDHGWPMNNPVLPLYDVQRAQPQPYPYPTVAHAASSHSIPGHGSAAIRSSASGSHDPQSVRMRRMAASSSPSPITPPPPRAAYDPSRPPAPAQSAANRRSSGSHLR